MTAKPADAPQQQPASIIGNLQKEVASEASPMMDFLINHARSIALIIFVFILAIAGYWIYESMAQKRVTSDIKELDQVLAVSDPAARLVKLEAFAAKAPDSVRRAAYFCMLDAAVESQNQEKIHEAWKAIAGFDKSFTVTATLGMANALSAQGKEKETLALLDSIAKDLTGADVAIVNARIVMLAEDLGDYKRASAACDAVLSTTGLPVDSSFWNQKKAELEAKMK